MWPCVPDQPDATRPARPCLDRCGASEDRGAPPRLVEGAPGRRGPEAAPGGEGDGRVEIDETFLLEQVEEAEAPADLAGEARPGTVFSLLRVARADLARLRAAQALLASQGEEERAGRLGTLSVSVTGCVSGTPVAGPVLVSTYLEAAEFGRFVPLVLDVDLRREMERKDGARLEGCPRPS